MKERPDVKSVVHCHPPHATAFAVAREPIPQCVLPEVEVFLGDVPITKYETPGGQAFADTVLPFVKKCERHHLGQSRHGQLRRDGGKGLLVDRDSGRLLPHPDDGQGPGQASLTFDRAGKSPRAVGPENAPSGASPTRGWTPAYEKLRHLRQRRVPRFSGKRLGVERRAFEAPELRCKPAGNPNAPPSRAAAFQRCSGPSASPTSNDQEALVQAITERVLAALARANRFS